MAASDLTSESASELGKKGAYEFSAKASGSRAYEFGSRASVKSASAKSTLNAGKNSAS